MDVELLEIVDFLQQVIPFNQLPLEAQQALAKQLKIQYARRDSLVMNLGEANDTLYLVRKGAADIESGTSELLARCDEGEFFGFYSLLMNCPVKHKVRAMEDSLLYCIPRESYQRLSQEHSFIKEFFLTALEQRMHKSLQAGEQNKQINTQLLNHKLEDLIARKPVTAVSETLVYEAADIMSEHGVSSLLVVSDNPKTKGHLLGVLTDSDLRKRVVAKQGALDQPIGNIMTPYPATINRDDYAFEAMMLMLKNNIHHLPVVDGPLPLGMITVGDLIRLESESSVYLVSDIYKKNTVAELSELSYSLNKMFLNLEESHTSAENITHIVTSINDAITSRLLYLAELELIANGLGEAPIDYCWVALGSQAREEQTVHSDQDNALLLDNSYEPEQHGEYFKALARFVNHGLDQCGYIFCPGDVMASNDKWRQPLSAWQQQFDRWVKTPTPEALMHIGIFFDMRAIFGKAALLDSLKNHIKQLVPGQTLFLAHLANNALQHRPPLGFFRKFVLEQDGSHDNTINAKMRGIVPIIDVARVYALAAGITEPNTLRRLQALEKLQGKHQVMSHRNSRNLQDAFELISMIRINHQTAQIRSDNKPTNYLDPSQLSSLERRHLRDAFSMTASQQKSMSNHFNTNMLG